MKAILRITLFLACFQTANAQQFNPLLSQMLQDTLNTAVGFIPNIKGMSASVYLPGQGIWQGTKGVSFAGTPITKDMEFGIASNTKLFTSTVMLMLQENGVISLNDSISKWIPNLNPSINHKITIRQLLNHTSGIPEVICLAPYVDTVKNNPNRVFAPTEVVSWVNSSTFPAGTSYNYSNTNYVLAGMIAENATGFHISKIIRDIILTPLNMDSTFYDVKEPVVGNIAHRWWNGITGPSLIDYNAVSRVGINSAVGAAGAMFSTSSEMAQWYHALFSGQLLNPSSMAELTTFVATTSPTQQYGLGLFQETTQGLTYWGHGGDTWGYKDKMIYDNCSGAVVCGLTNSYPNGMSSVPFMLLRVIKNHVPSCPGAITGLTTVCQGQNAVTYTVPVIAHATSYTWTLPSGATGISSTNSITVNYGTSAISGNITVKGNSIYGEGNSSSLAIVVNVCTLVDESAIGNDEIIISPNPFSMQTTLRTDNALQNATLTVYNSSGQTVKQIKNINGQTVVLLRDNLASGLYFIRLTEDNKIIVVDKLVITD
jgi:D-alanyl-D-alanine carboxypeptidase